MTTFEEKMRSAGKRFGFDLTVVSSKKDAAVSLVEIDRGSITHEGKKIRASIRYNPETMAKYGDTTIIAEDEAIHCILNPDATHVITLEEKAAALTEAMDHMVLLEHINREYLPRISKKAGSRLGSLTRTLDALQKGLPHEEEFYGKVVRTIEESGAKDIEGAMGPIETLVKRELAGEDAKNTALVICIIIGASNNPLLIGPEAQKELLALFGAEEAGKSINYQTLSKLVGELYESLGNDKERRARYLKLYEAAKSTAITRKHWWQ